MAQNIVPNDMCETGAKQVQLFERGLRVTFPMNNSFSIASWHCGKGEYPGFFGINLQINRQTARQDFGLASRHLSFVNFREISLWFFGLQWSATAKGFRYAAGNYVFHTGRLVFNPKERDIRKPFDQRYSLDAMPDLPGGASFSCLWAS